MDCSLIGVLYGHSTRDLFTDPSVPANRAFEIFVFVRDFKKEVLQYMLFQQAKTAKQKKKTEHYGYRPPRNRMELVGSL